jgi:hypothetical protein
MPNDELAGLPRRLLECADEVMEFPHPSHCDHLHDASSLMREASAELLRLAREHKTMRDVLEILDVEGLKAKIARAESELAALRKRIAEAPVIIGNEAGLEVIAAGWDGVRVALLVLDGGASER